jgi:putative flippase GtrA
MLKNRLVRYLIVGVSAYLMEMAVLFGLHDGLGLSPVASVAISFWFGLVVAFVLQKFVTFQNRDKKVKVVSFQLTLYGCLVAVNYLITLLAVKHLSPKYSVFAIRTGVIALGTIWNYVIYNRFLFKIKPVELDDRHAKKD